MTEVNVLETIRQAYRYIVAYERRVLDAIGSVDEALLGRGFEREKSEPLYTSWPRRSKVLDPHWAWDEVPNYARRFPWRFGEPNTAGVRWVFVDHVADTAFEARQIWSKQEPDPLHDLEPVEGSNSVLRWTLASFTAPLPVDVYRRVWFDRVALSRHLGVEVTDLRVSRPAPAPIRHAAAPIALTIQCVDLAALTDRDAVRVRLLEPLLASLGAP